MLKARHKVVAIAVALAIAIVLTGYVAAIAGSLLTGQFTSASPVRALEAWRTFSFDNKVFKTTFLVVAAVAAVSFTLTVFWLFEDKRSLHGNARFATAKDLEVGGLFAKNGIILAKFGRKFLVFSGQEFVLVAAPTRSGKGVSVVIPNLLNSQESAVVLDVKKENYLMTSGWRQKVLKQAVYLFDPFDPAGKTSRWNPIDSVSRDPNLMVSDVLQIAQIFYPSNQGDKNRFFQDTAQSLFMGLTLFLIETKHPRPTIGEIFRQGSGYGRPLTDHVKELLEKHPHLSNACQGALSRVLSAPGETFGNIKATFDAALLIFSIPTVDWATSASDFQLGEIRREKMTVYFGISVDKISLGQRLINLFFTQLINLNTRVLPEDDPTLKHQCLLINDEFTAPGRLDVVLKGVAFIAGYNLRLLTIIQSTSQLKDSNLYGREGAETLLANHAVRVIFPPTTDQEAKEYSEMLGTYTKDATSTSSSRSGKGLMSFSESISSGSNTSEQRRSLLLPQELKRLRKDVAIVEKQGVNPAKAHKAFYYNEPVFLNRLANVSPSLKALLQSRAPTQDEITAMRVRGEFAATLVTAPFAPFTHAVKDVETQTESPDTGDRLTPEPEVVKTVSLAQARVLLEARIPHFSALQTADDWIAAVFKEASALFPLIGDKEGASA